jgi:F-type H+-transporting ATPase subunit gamma
MSQLVKLRQRINTIQTIQKIAQAMRLVSMSVHSQLNNQLGYLKIYQAKLDQLANLVQSTEPNQTSNSKKSRLMILIGSQKGLCGSFNSDIIKALDQYQKKHPLPTEIVVIGKKLIDLAQRKHDLKIKVTKFNHTVLNETAHLIMDLVRKQPEATEIICLSNQNRSFFAHTVEITTLNGQSNLQLTASSDMLDDYLWEQPKAELAQTILHKQLSLSLHNILLNSLIAEASARFRSMDSATRNADTLLETSTRQYSKLRQAKITRELVELSAIFQIK